MMNGGQPRRISNRFKDKEEELSFFRDLQKREKDQVNSLLHPVSDEFDPCTHGMYKMESGGRKGTEVGFLADSEKKDYNWLKTPLATPLFPSLEMETNGQEFIIQREIPIIQPLSRFAGNQGSTKTRTVTNTSTTPPNPNRKLIQRHKTPNGRPTISSLIDKKNMKIAPKRINQKTSGLPDETKLTSAAVVKSTIKKENHPNNASSNREVSTLVRPNIPGFSEETLPNLRTTNRATSATRGRPTNQNQSTPRKQDVNSKIRRQSCSPSVARGRKVETDGNAAKQTTGNRAQVLGSRMVDRFISARISSAEERQTKMRQNGSVLNKNSSAEDRQPKIKMNGSSINESSGFGRLMSKSSLDVAIKHMEFQRDSSNTRKHGAIVPARKS